MIVALLALFVALGGSVYAAKKGKILGTTIKVNSMPGNRLKPHSITDAQIKAGTFKGSEIQPGSITGAQINEASLGQVPTAQYADNANSALDAQTALNAVNAENANKLNGHSAGCMPNTRFYAGACWQTSANIPPLNAPGAALVCGTLGGSLPEALELLAFSQQTGVALDGAGEWSNDILSFSGPNVYAVAVVFPNSVLASAISTGSQKYRCVIPLVS